MPGVDDNVDVSLCAFLGGFLAAFQCVYKAACSSFGASALLVVLILARTLYSLAFRWEGIIAADSAVESAFVLLRIIGRAGLTDVAHGAFLLLAL